MFQFKCHLLRETISGPLYLNNNIRVFLNCCITNYHRCSKLKQHPPMSSQFSRSEVWHSMAGSLAQSITRVGQAEFSSGSSGGKSSSQPVIGRIQFLACVELRSPFPYWLSAPRSLSHRLLSLLQPIGENSAFKGLI